MSLTLSGNSPKITADSTGVITSGTSVTASGTQVNFTDIPSWVKRITVMFNGVSTNGSSPMQIQIGNGSIVTSGYLGSTFGTAGAAVSNSNITTGFGVRSGWAAGVTIYGVMPICNVSGNIWTTSFFNVSSDGNNGGAGGGIALGGTLDRIRITTVNGTDTFDAGSINILYE